jgi:hypothetical protein
MEGVNEELMPLVRMTVPRRARGLTLAGGVVPFDAHFLCLEAIGERRFLERSSSLLQRVWEHERTVVPEGGGCRVTDRVTFEPRLPGAARLAGPLVERIFRHRHRRLVARFGAPQTVRPRG